MPPEAAFFEIGGGEMLIISEFPPEAAKPRFYHDIDFRRRRRLNPGDYFRVAAGGGETLVFIMILISAGGGE